MHIRSFQRAFPTDRRIYRIDRWTIPVPGGLPLAATAWFLAIAIIVGAICHAPILNAIPGTLGWPATVIVLPGAAAVALTRRAPDGRTLPVLLWQRLQYVVRARRYTTTGDVVAARLPDRLWVAPDTSLPGVTRVCGPGRVRIPSSTSAELDRRGHLRLIGGTALTRIDERIVQLDHRDRIEVES